MIMDKMYHVYNKENQCVDPCLSEEEFRNKWKDLTVKTEEYEYEELEMNRTIIQNGSY